MTEVTITPDRSKKVPYDLRDEKPASFLDELNIAGNTAEVQVALGVSLDVDDATREEEKTFLREAIKNKKTKRLSNVNTAYAAAAFLRTYGAQLALDVAAARAAITNKLMELANCGDPKFELKALELLGKHSDIGLFTERSEVTINYKSPEALEDAIKERVKRLLKSEMVDITPSGCNLDDEFGVVHTGRIKAELDTELGTVGVNNKQHTEVIEEEDISWLEQRPNKKPEEPADV